MTLPFVTDHGLGDPHKVVRTFLPILEGKKKADVAETPEGFDHVGLLFNQPPGTAGLPFNESSEIQFNDPTEPISN